MSTTPNINEQQILIFDTGPLRELILYSAVHNLGFQLLKGELHHLTERAYHTRLTEFINRFPQRTTSSQVVSEIGAWIHNKTMKSGHANIWRIVRDEFKSMGMDEAALKFLDMHFDLIVEKGIADASVLHLGLRHAARKPQVLTFDRALAAECKRSGVNAVTFWEVIAQGDSSSL
jgi:hypothetical protein